MHASSMKEMEKFVTKYLSVSSVLRIIDVGSMDLNGRYCELFSTSPLWKYTGIDIAAGNNVNLVVPPYSWPFDSNSVDVVVSGQCLEHVEDIFAWAAEIGRILKVGGVCCIIAPWSDGEHRHPVDCWRVLPDGMRFLLEKKAGLFVLEKYHNCPSNDCVGIATKKSQEVDSHGR
jgi:SAM-dependent methyltransferase